MPELSQNITIPKNTATKDELDFAYLRSMGIDYLQQIAGKLWTDYNSHDPGVTILEMLCYAITDLGLRINKPMKDLLAMPNDGKPQFFEAHEILPCTPVNEIDYRKLFIDIKGVKNAWLGKFEPTMYIHCKEDLLSFKNFPIPATDQHSFKVKGLYEVLIDFDELDADVFDTVLKKQEEIARIIKEIEKRYQKNRNLCEDLVKVRKVDVQPIAVCTVIDLHPTADEELVLAKIKFEIGQYFSPSLHFYTLQQLLDKGHSPEEIFEGPLLENGFLDTNEVEKAKLRKEIRLSDLIKIISEIEGVNVVKEISMGKCDGVNPPGDDWLICLENGLKPELCDKSTFSFYKGFLPLNINQKRVKPYLKELREQEAAQESDAAAASKVLNIDRGVYSDLSETTTIQNDFPEVYGIGKYGITGRADEERKAKAKQLKAYLLFFDQILADYFKSLSAVRDLLSVNSDFSKVSFAQKVQDLSGIDTLVSDAYKNDDLASLLYDGLVDQNQKNNEILDHLLARFAEDFGEYAFLMNQLYGNFVEEAIIHTKKDFVANYAEISTRRGLAFQYCKPAEGVWDTFNVSYFEKRIALLLGISDISRRDLSKDPIEVYEEKDEDDKSELRWRIRNLDKEILSSGTKHYENVGELYAELELVKKYAKDKANYELKKNESDQYYINLINPEVQEANESRIIARKIQMFDAENLAEQAIEKAIEFISELHSNEGMYLIENILLMPDISFVDAPVDTFLPICTEDCVACEEVDPYSFRVTIVLPGWTERFVNPDFRAFAEDLIRKELPAHIMARICWIGQPEYMITTDNDMKRLEKAWKEFLEQKALGCITYPDEKLKNLIAAIGKLNTIYPEGRLFDCDDETDNLKGKIILGRTNI